MFELFGGTGPPISGGPPNSVVDFFHEVINISNVIEKTVHDNMQLNFKSFIDFGGPNRPNSMLGVRELWHPFLALRYLYVCTSRSDQLSYVP